MSDERPSSSSRTDLRRGAAARARDYAFVAVPLLLFLQGASSHIAVPGVYMDAVNPDYLVVRLFVNPKLVLQTYAWILPGSLLFDKYPIIAQIYHGALPYYLGLPAYLLFGTGVVGIRVANFCFGSLVILGAAIFLRAFQVRPWLAAAGLAALALDPGFLFSFRTQFYITLLPIFLVFISAAIVERNSDSPSRRSCFQAGVSIGLSIYGYFIFLFPALIAFVHLWGHIRKNERRSSLLLFWSLGVALGVAPYAIAFVAMAIAEGGIVAFIDFFEKLLSALSIEKSTLSLGMRFEYAFHALKATTLAEGPVRMMLGDPIRLWRPDRKTILLLVVPALAVAYALARRGRQTSGLRLAAGYVLAFCALFLVFGNRVSLHHAAPILPVLYVGLILTLDAAARFGPAEVWIERLGVLVLAFMCFGNAIDRQNVITDLERTGGVGLSSDAIERFAQDALSYPSPTFAFFPDWGVFMPFEMVTSGRILLSTDFTPKGARQVLCSGKDALLGVMNNVNPERLPPWIDAVNWGTPEVTIYRQRDDVPVLTAVRWRATALGHAPCP